MKLNLGCGPIKLDGYINVDLHFNADVQADILDLPDDWKGMADEVLAVHVLEHLTFYQSQPALLEWKRVLKPGGLIAIECPNLKEACLSYLRKPEELDRGIWCFYGNQQWENMEAVHKSGWTPDSLIKALKTAGFKEARQAPAQYKRKEPRDFRVEAIK